MNTVFSFNIYNCRRYAVFLLFVAIVPGSCKKFVEVAAPINSLESSKVFQDSTSASATIVAIYSLINRNSSGIEATITRHSSAGSDETYVSAGSDSYEYYTNTISKENANINSLWSDLYQRIYDANAIINGLASSPGISASVKERFTAEAKFIRAFCYSWLVNIYGEAPIVTSTDYVESAMLPRSATSVIYDLIIRDLLDAQAGLPAEYITSSRARPNKWTAAALLGRMYLYNQRWSEAETAASGIINAGIYSLETPENVFVYTSNETIWQFFPGPGRFNSTMAPYFIPSSSALMPNYILTNDLIISMDPADLRLSTWTNTNNIGGIDYRYPYKYKKRTGTSIASATEYNIAFRLAEQYLIRAEARAHQGNLDGAKDDINMIRRRAGLTDITTPASQAECLDSIYHEKRIEFMAEWGHRWFDLKRTGLADSVLGIVKGSNWQTTDQLWPVPEVQRRRNINLSQNNGY